MAHRWAWWGAVLPFLGLAAGCGGPTCGMGTVEKDKMCVPVPDTNNGAVSSIKLSFLSPARSLSAPVYIDSPLTLNFGILAQGMPAEIGVYFELVGKYAADATDEQKEAAPRCPLGTVDVQLNADGKEQPVSGTFYVPDECAPGTYNLAVMFDPSEATTIEDDGTTIFNAELSGENQGCRSGVAPNSGGLGCVYDLNIAASPGIDVTLDSVEPTSRVGLVFGKDAVDPATPVSPIFEVNTTLRLLGRHDADAAAATLPGTAQVQYSIMPSNNTSGVDWRPLSIADLNAGGTHTTSVSLTQLTPEGPNVLWHNLYAEGATLTLLSPGGAWANQRLFLLRGCILPSFAESDQDPSDKSNAGADNCKEEQVQILPAPLPSLRPGYDLSKEFSRKAGSDNTVQISFSANTNNSLDVENGAKSENSAKITLDTLIGSIDMVDASAKGEVPFDVGEASLEASLSIFTNKVYGFDQKGKEINYEKDFPLMKEKCFNKRIPIGPVPLIKLELCAVGMLGLELKLTLRGEMGGSAMFPAATMVGALTGLARPYANATLNGKVSLDVIIYRAGIGGTVSLIDVGAPLTLNAYFGQLMPGQLGIKVDGNWKVPLKLLDGKVEIFVDSRTDVSQIVKCGLNSVKRLFTRKKNRKPCFEWKNKYNKPLFTFTAAKYEWTLFNKATDQVLM